jgi:hypothetical protein
VREFRAAIGEGERGEHRAEGSALVAPDSVHGPDQGASADER